MRWELSSVWQFSTAQDQTLERWDLVQAFLAGDKVAIDWANDWPQGKLVKSGSAS